MLNAENAVSLDTSNCRSAVTELPRVLWLLPHYGEKWPDHASTSAQWFSKGHKYGF